jgi:hypothetical protein
MIVPPMVYTLAIPCAVAIVLLARKLLQRLAIRVETQPAA